MIAADLWFILGVSILVFWPSLLMVFRKEDASYYEDKIRTSVAMAPPSWLFPVVWYIIYALITAALVIYGQATSAVAEISDIYITILVLAAVNLTLNHFWTLLFFRSRQYGWSILVIVIIILTGITIDVLMAIEGGWTGWTAFGLFMAYPLWCLFALYLNARWCWIKYNADVKSLLGESN
jgi:translocator protein